jgi:hypothetical protein
MSVKKGYGKLENETSANGTSAQQLYCALTACGKHKMEGSEYCSTLHEERHMKIVANEEGLEGICKAYQFNPNTPLPQYRCLSCGYQPNNHCCSVCAAICHRGHDVVMHPGTQAIYCDCGADYQCSCMPATKRAKKRSSASSFASSVDSKKKSDGTDALAKSCYKHANTPSVNNCAYCSQPICSNCTRVLNHRIVCPTCQAKNQGGGFFSFCPCWGSK